MQQNLQSVEQIPNPLESRIIKTPSVVARRAFFYVQECGHLKASGAQKTSRKDLPSYLFAVVLDGQGSLTYEHGKLALMEVAQAVMEQREAGER